MKQSLSLNLKQKLVMTPQLQQSINLLQLSTYELKALIEEEYMKNPTLELDEPISEDVSTGADSTASADATTDFWEYLAKDEDRPEAVASVDYKVKELSLNQRSLEEVLVEQLRFSSKSKQEIALASYIAGLLDGNGYLSISLHELAKLLHADMESLEAAIALVQSLEPAGVGARDLQECLTLQAQRSGLYDGLLKSIIEAHLLLVAEARLKDIAKIERVAVTEVQQAVDLLRKEFNPKPGAAYSKDAAEFVTPDVSVRDISGKLEILLNESALPKLRINSLYRKQHLLDDASKEYIEEKMNAALWLIKSIEQRRLTLLKVVKAIVNRQHNVFYQGFTALQPLTMKDIATDIDMHESTVSRTVANKYMDMPFGVVPFKAFFASGVVGTEAGGEIVADRVKLRLRELIEAEDRTKPLSDQQLADILVAEEVQISRRTVMKYREQLGYPSSAKRKRYE